jgi:hypothetical protein
MALGADFHLFFRGKPCKVYPAPFDVRLFYEEDESDDTVVQPDLTVICDVQVASGDVVQPASLHSRTEGTHEKKPGPEGGRGAPDLVVEILSPSNTALEMERKFELYRQAGVREYWVIAPEHKTLHAYRFETGQIGTRSYGSSDTAQVEIFPGLAIPLEPVFAE